MPFLIESFGSQIAKRRVYLALNQADLAEMAGVTIRTIYNIEHGHGNPSLQTLEKIMDILGFELIVQLKNVEP